MKTQNVPYKKEYTNGIVSNPITKENPYPQSPSDKGDKKLRLSKNKRGVQLVVAKIGDMSFLKYFKFNQIARGGKLKAKGVKSGQFGKNRLVVNSVLKP